MHGPLNVKLRDVYRGTDCIVKYLNLTVSASFLSFLSHHSPINLQFGAIQSQLLTASLNTPTNILNFHVICMAK
jgi:hypothetical protein